MDVSHDRLDDRGRHLDKLTKCCAKTGPYLIPITIESGPRRLDLVRRIPSSSTRRQQFCRSPPEFDNPVQAHHNQRISPNRRRDPLVYYYAPPAGPGSNLPFRSIFFVAIPVVQDFPSHHVRLRTPPEKSPSGTEPVLTPIPRRLFENRLNFRRSNPMPRSCHCRRICPRDALCVRTST